MATEKPKSSFFRREDSGSSQQNENREETREHKPRESAERREWKPRTENAGGERREWKPRTENSGERREWKPRTENGGAERREWKPRTENAGGERREWKPRTENSGERREWKPRTENGGGERREWKPRTENEGGERREWKPRTENEGGERREWKPRTENSGERREWKPRTENGGGERREWKPRTENAGGERREWKPRTENSGERREWKPRTENAGGERREWKPRLTEPREWNGEFSEDKPRTYLTRERRLKERAENSPLTQKAETDPKAPIRLNRYIAMSGVCSRREADVLITGGQVTVNGVVVDQMGAKVTREDKICLNGELLKGERKVYIIMNKPKGFVTTTEDPHADRTIIDLLKGEVKERVYPIGRLDKNTTGVILLTNDGEITNMLTHPSFEKRKLYHVFLNKPCTAEDLAKLISGVELEDGEIHADEAEFVEGLLDEIGIEIHSGRNRIVRRMFEHLGYDVVKLDRVYFAGFTKMGLRRGFWRYLTPREVATLKSGNYN